VFGREGTFVHGEGNYMVVPVEGKMEKDARGIQYLRMGAALLFVPRGVFNHIQVADSFRAYHSSV